MAVITPGALNSGGIVTANLADDSVDATKIDFGTGTNQVDTDVLTEGATNLYFTNERVDDRVNALLTAGANISLTYDDAAGTLTIAATEDNLSNNNTDDLSEGSSNLYFTNARAVSAVLNTSHSGAITLGSDNNVRIESGTDAGENIYLKSKDNFLGVDSAYLFIDADSNAIKLSVAGTGSPSEIEVDTNLNLDGNLDVSGFIGNDGNSGLITALDNGDRFGVIGGIAANGSTLPTASNCQIEMITTENQTGSARGAQVKIETTATGATSRTATAQFAGNDTTLINLITSGTIVLSNLPTSDPTNAGQLYNDSGTLKVSAG
jgi:hypothetical protein